jgi:RNA polymerase sigma-70 factor, ECF subfamily
VLPASHQSVDFGMRGSPHQSGVATSSACTVVSGCDGSGASSLVRSSLRALRILQAGGISRATWGDEPIALRSRLRDARDEQGGEDGALRDVYERCDGGERCPATRRGWPCQEATRLEAAEAAPNSESPPQAIAGSRRRSTKSSLTPAPLAAPATNGGRRTLDEESRAWLHSLSVDRSDDALDRLRTLLLRATRFEVARRRDELLHVDDSRLDELARTAADAAALSAVAHLDRYRPGSRFTIWAAKFALLEAAVRLRELAWRESAPTRLRRSAQERSSLELRATGGEGTHVLTAEQRQVFEALIIDGVPIDVVAERMQMTRGDVYQRLHTARGVLRERLMRADPV